MNKHVSFYLLLCFFLSLHLTSTGQTPRELQAEINELKEDLKLRDKQTNLNQQAAKLDLEKTIKKLKEELNKEKIEQAKIYNPILIGVISALIGALGGVIGMRQYIKNQLQSVVDIQIKDREKEWEKILQGQKIDKTIIENKKILTLSFEHKDESELSGYLAGYDFPKANLEFRMFKFDEDNNLINKADLMKNINKKDLIIFNANPIVFGEENTKNIVGRIVKEVINEVEKKSARPYFFGYSRGLFLPKGIEKLNFCTNKYTLFSNLMDSLRYQELFEKHSRV